MPGPRRLLPACALLSTLLFAACGADGGSRSVDRYCDDLAEQAQLLNFDLVTLDDVEGLRERYTRFAETAPLAVEEQWRQLADLMDAAATIDLTSEESRAAVVEQAASTERAANQIADHAAATCGITLLMGTPPPATTTTVEPPATTAPPETTSVPAETTAVPAETTTTVAPPAST